MESEGTPRSAEMIVRPRTVDNKLLRHRTRRDFLLAAASAAAGVGAWHWLRTRAQADGMPWPQRRVLELNENIANGLFSDNHHTPQLVTGSAPPKPRVNGDYGLDENFDFSKWKLHVGGLLSGRETLTLDAIRELPKVRMTMRLCCIEGWSILVNWGGARFADFAKAYPPMKTEYVAMSTPDRQYYVGLDMASAIHPQTLLCYEIDEQPLTAAHGAPLRLVIPTKYGIKNIKRIGSIDYTAARPPDYWAQQGYDWYAGL